MSLGEAVEVICTEYELTAQELQEVMIAVSANREKLLRIARLISLRFPGTITLTCHEGKVSNTEIRTSVEALAWMLGEHE